MLERVKKDSVSVLINSAVSKNGKDYIAAIITINNVRIGSLLVKRYDYQKIKLALEEIKLDNK